MDEVDFSVLKILSENCRTPYEAMARSVGLTGNAVRERVRRLIEDGVIERFWLCVNPAIFGYNVVVSVLESCPVAGEYMFTVESLNGYCTAVTLSGGREGMRGAALSFVYPKAPPTCVVSETDKRIIRSLREDPRRSIHSISESLGVSAKSVKRAVDKLVRNDVVSPTIIVQPAAIEGFIPYYLMVWNEPGRRAEDGARNWWFRQRIGDLTIMECYAKSFRDMEGRLSVLDHAGGVSSYIYMVPSRLSFSDRGIPEI
jgi:DNA-binding Lrp family transcriptional regulator